MPFHTLLESEMLSVQDLPSFLDTNVLLESAVTILLPFELQAMPSQRLVPPPIVTSSKLLPEFVERHRLLSRNPAAQILVPSSDMARYLYLRARGRSAGVAAASRQSREEILPGPRYPGSFVLPLNVLPESVLTQILPLAVAATTLPSFEHACGGPRETRKAGAGLQRRRKAGAGLPRRRSRAMSYHFCWPGPTGGSVTSDHVFVESVERQMYPPLCTPYTVFPFPEEARATHLSSVPSSRTMTLVKDLAESVDRHLGRAPVSTEPRPRRLDRMSTSQPRRRRDSSSRNIHVAAAAAPRPRPYPRCEGYM